MATTESNSTDTQEAAAVAAPGAAAPAGTRLTMRLPDDFHHHARDGATTAAVLAHATRRFGRCLVMPNTKPPITTTEMALAYKQHIETSIIASISSSSTRATTTTVVPHFQPLLVLYLTDQTTPDEIRKAHAAGVTGCKYYPAGATTNSEFGVTNVKRCYPALQELSNLGMMLCIHSEVTHGHVDIFAREVAFIDEIMRPLVRDFPKLKITMEHISTQQAVDYILSAAPDNVKATITCHHLLYNRNDLLVGGIRPHLYCLPILKAEVHRQALVRAATSGSPKFFLGTDSAPHDIVTAKETACGCAGIYTAHAAVELYAEVFDQAGALHQLEAFCSWNGARHYGLEPNTAMITLEKTAWTVPDSYDLGDGKRVKGLRAGEKVQWSLVEDATVSTA